MKTLKPLTTLLFILISFLSCGQTVQQNWEQQAKRDIRLKPKYGHVEKTPEQKEADKKFIEVTLNSNQYNGDNRMASDQLIERGFQYFYDGDLKTAMYRFNQAYLLDSLNSDIYWGFGGVYMMLQRYEEAKDQYEEGLKLNPKNTNLLTDYGMYFLTKFQESKSQEQLDKAINVLSASYDIDQKNQNTLFKLSVCYLLQNDCINARKYYNLCKQEGGKPITEEYTNELNRVCQ